jgi:hypothetical protein
MQNSQPYKTQVVKLLASFRPTVLTFSVLKALGMITAVDVADSKHF